MRTQTIINPPEPPFFLDEEFLAEINKSFDSIEIEPAKHKKQKGKSKSRVKAKRSGVAEMQQTYIGLAQMHLRPTFRYMKAVKLGLAVRDVCEMLHYVVAPIILKTKKVGLHDHARVLIAFQRELKKVLSTRSYRMTTEQREVLLKSYEPIQKYFGLDFRGHSAAVFNLLGYFKALKKNKNVTETELKKLFAIGIPSLTMLRTSSIQEISSLSGISGEKAQSLRSVARKFNILEFLA